MLRPSKSKLWSVFCGGLLAGWLGSYSFEPAPTSAGPDLNGLPFEEISARLNALEAASSLFSVNDGTLVVKGQVDFVNADNVVTTSINGVDPTRGIIAILTCPPEPDRQSLTVNGPALFHNENGSFMQVNNCHDPDAPTVDIGLADIGLESPTDHTALRVSGPLGKQPLVQLTTEEPLFDVEFPGPVLEANPWHSIPTLPQFRGLGMRVNGRDEQVNVFADGLEMENRLKETHSCLNSIELLVRCGGDATPAGIRTNPDTGETSIYAEQLNADSAGFNELFSRDITTFNLTEIMGTDGPF